MMAWPLDGADTGGEWESFVSLLSIPVVTVLSPNGRSAESAPSATRARVRTGRIGAAGIAFNHLGHEYTVFGFHQKRFMNSVLM